MKKDVAKGVAFVLVTIATGGVLIFGNLTNPLVALVASFLSSILVSPISFGIVEGLSNIRNLRLFWKTYVVYRNQHVRLSISYLFRIRVNDKYLLVKNRKGNYYQLVGGAYKTLPGFEKIQEKYCIEPDRKFKTCSGIAKGDLRFTLPGKFVVSIIKWFQSREDRETSQWREFCEELLTTGILDKHIFRYIDFKYVTTLQTPIKKAKNIDCQEVLIYEIFDLVPNNEQIQALNELLEAGDTNEVKWADLYLIERLGYNERNKDFEYHIGAHTKWAILKKWSEE